MQHDLELHRSSGFMAIGFSDKVARCVERTRRAGQSFSIANRDQIAFMLSVARQSIGIADDRVINALLVKNPDLFRVSLSTSDDSQPDGMFAYLPLNDLGVEMLMTGRFDGTQARPEWIVRPGEQPVAIYIWLVYLPNRFGRSVGKVANLFDSLTNGCCPVFSRSISDSAARLSKGMGFLPAEQFYPDCKPGLMVAFPKKEVIPNKAPVRAVTIARSIDEIFKVFAVRSATYLAEQFCFYDEEFDGNDFCATHLLGTIDGDAAGCIRIRYFADFAKIERLAVRYEYRNSRLAFDLARAAIKLCQQKGYRKVLGHSRSDLVRFWGMFGFKERDARDAFSFANVQYSEIVLDLDPVAGAIKPEVNPMVLIRPEGIWDRPGPLDISASENDPRRKRLLEERTRSVRQKRIVKV